jgi:hypothetical protein
MRWAAHPRSTLPASLLGRVDETLAQGFTQASLRWGSVIKSMDHTHRTVVNFIYTELQFVWYTNIIVDYCLGVFTLPARTESPTSMWRTPRLVRDCSLRIVIGITGVAQKVWTLPQISNLIGGDTILKNLTILSANRNHTFKFEQLSKVCKQFSVVRWLERVVPRCLQAQTCWHKTAASSLLQS